MNLVLSLKQKMGRMGRMGAKFFEPPSSYFQGGVHISHQASLFPEERGCNRPPVLLFYLSVSPARRAPHPNQATIGFTTLSVTLTGDRNPSRKGKDVTALRCSEPLCYKVGGASKPCAILCGLGPHGDKNFV